MPDTTPKYSYCQRMAWLRDHTRHNPETGAIEMWHIFDGAWLPITCDTLRAVYPVIVRGVLTGEEAWREIAQVAPEAPAYEGDQPPVERYDAYSVDKWFLENHRLASDGETLQRRSPIDREWYSLPKDNRLRWGPRDFLETYNNAFLSRAIATDKEKRRNPPKPKDDGKISAAIATSKLLFGGDGRQTGGNMASAETIAFDAQAFARWEETNTALLSTRRIAEAFLGITWPMGPVALRLLTASLKEAGWTPQRSGTARWWVKNAGSDN